MLLIPKMYVIKSGHQADIYAITCFTLTVIHYFQGFLVFWIITSTFVPDLEILQWFLNNEVDRIL